MAVPVMFRVYYGSIESVHCLPMIRTRIAVATLAALLLTPALAREPACTLDRATALATFDAAWRLVDQSPYDVRGKGIDWDAVRERHRPAAEQARDSNALRRSINAMLDEIGESHFMLIPASVGAIASSKSSAKGEQLDGIRDTGLRAAIVEGHLAVTAVHPGSAAERAGIRSGWLIEQIDDHALGDVLSEIQRGDTPAHRRIAMLRLEGAVATRLEPTERARPMTLALRDTSGTTHEVRLIPQPAAGTRVDIPLLPPMLFNIEHRRIAQTDGSCVGLIHFNVWLPALAQTFPSTLDAVRDCRGLVIDLRGNPGGVIGTAMGVGGWLVDTPTPLGYINAGGSTARLPALPRRVNDDGKLIATYAAPVAILIDSRSASTSEVFTSGLQQAGRAHVFGSRSAGMALPSLMHPLPNGDDLLYAVADLTAPDGSRLEGIGIAPNQPSAPTLAGLAAGRDQPLDAAIGWIKTTPFSTKKED